MRPHQTTNTLVDIRRHCLWTYTKAVICNGHKNMDDFRDKKGNSVIVAVNLAYSRVSGSHILPCGDIRLTSCKKSFFDIDIAVYRAMDSLVVVRGQKQLSQTHHP